jgi:hypothetical protein
MNLGNSTYNSHNFLRTRKNTRTWTATNTLLKYNTIQHNTTQYNTIQYNTIQYNTIHTHPCTISPFPYTRPWRGANQRSERLTDRPSRLRLSRFSLVHPEKVAMVSPTSLQTTTTSFPYTLLFINVLVGSLDSAAGTATRIRADRPMNRGSTLSRGRIFISSPKRPVRVWAHPASYPMGTGWSFPRGEAAEACTWPLTPMWCRCQEWVKVYLHYPIRLHARPRDITFTVFGRSYHSTLCNLIWKRCR